MNNPSPKEGSQLSQHLQNRKKTYNKSTYLNEIHANFFFSFSPSSFFLSFAESSSPLTDFDKNSPNTLYEPFCCSLCVCLSFVSFLLFSNLSLLRHRSIPSSFWNMETGMWNRGSLTFQLLSSRLVLNCGRSPRCFFFISSSCCLFFQSWFEHTGFLSKAPSQRAGTLSFHLAKLDPCSQRFRQDVQLITIFCCWKYMISQISLPFRVLYVPFVSSCIPKLLSFVQR